MLAIARNHFHQSTLINICHDFYGYHNLCLSFFLYAIYLLFFFYVYVLSWFISLFYSSPSAEDDILDEADTRRGEQAAHVRLGERAAALVGDFLWPGGISGRSVAGWETFWQSAQKIQPGRNPLKSNRFLAEFF